MDKEWTNELELEAEKFASQTAYALFGDNEKRAKNIWKSTARKFHSDGFVAKDKVKADAAFKKVNEKWIQWEALYKPSNDEQNNNKNAENNVISIGADNYIIKKCSYESAQIKIFTLSDNGEDVLLIISRRKTAIFDVERLKQIADNTSKAGECDAFFPKIVKYDFSIPQEDGQYSALLVKIDNFDQYRSLSYFRSLGTGVLDPKDIAWIWRRTISVGAIHADYNILWSCNPEYEFINPETHDYISLSDLIPMTEAGTSAEAIANGAKCLGDLLKNPPTQIKNHFNAVGRVSQKAIHPAYVLSDFDYLIDKLWGERKFHKFIYPLGFK